MRKRFPFLFLDLPLIGTFLFGCSSSSTYNVRVYAFDTLFDITLFEGKRSNCDDILKMVGDLSRVSDSYSDYDGNVHNLNEKGSVTKSKELGEILAYSMRMIEISGGAFSPFLFNLNEAWKDALQKGEILDDGEIATYLEQASSTRLEFKEETISLIGEGKIDLGGIAKGYCLDKIKSYLDENKISSYRISGGSSSILLGKTGSSDKPNFTLSFRDYPSIGYQTRECGVSTSSISEQRYEVGGVTYSHIVNAKTGSAKPSYQAISLIGNPQTEFPNAYMDAMSTAFFSYEEEDIIRVCQESDLRYLIVTLEEKAITDLN